MRKFCTTASTAVFVGLLLTPTVSFADVKTDMAAAMAGGDCDTVRELIEANGLRKFQLNRCLTQVRKTQISEAMEQLDCASLAGLVTNAEETVQLDSCRARLAASTGDLSAISPSYSRVLNALEAGEITTAQAKDQTEALLEIAENEGGASVATFARGEAAKIDQLASARLAAIADEQAQEAAAKAAEEAELARIRESNRQLRMAEWNKTPNYLVGRYADIEVYEEMDAARAHSLGLLCTGAQVKILDKHSFSNSLKGDWLRIETDDGLTGWVNHARTQKVDPLSDAPHFIVTGDEKQRAPSSRWSGSTLSSEKFHHGTPVFVSSEGLEDGKILVSNRTSGCGWVEPQYVVSEADLTEEEADALKAAYGRAIWRGVQNRKLRPAFRQFSSVVNYTREIPDERETNRITVRVRNLETSPSGDEWCDLEIETRYELRLSGQTAKTLYAKYEVNAGAVINEALKIGIPFTTTLEPNFFALGRSSHIRTISCRADYEPGFSGSENSCPSVHFWTSKSEGELYKIEDAFKEFFATCAAYAGSD